MRLPTRLIPAAALALCAAAHAQDVWEVTVYDGKHAAFAHGSATAVAAGLLTTDCALLRQPGTITVARGKLQYAAHATRGKSGAQCELSAPGLPWPAPPLPAIADAQATPDAPPPRAHPPVASGYAAIGEVDKLATVNPQARSAYQEFLARPLPRAFALADNGGWWSAWGSEPSDPMLRAVADCEARHHTHCTLYAVDDIVVYQRKQDTP